MRWHVVYTDAAGSRIYCKDCGEKGQCMKLTYKIGREHVDSNRICDRCGSLLRYSMVDEDGPQ